MPYSPVGKEMPLALVGSSKFGRYPKISLEKTYNMIVSDGWLVNYAGHETVAEIADNAEGRGIFTSINYNHMILVINNGVYQVDSGLGVSKIASIGTHTGDVYIEENNVGQIAICDKSALYIFNYNTGVFSKVSLDFKPVYVEFQNSFFICPESSRAAWRLSDNNNGFSWPVINTGAFSAKADKPVAVVRVPGKGNLVLVIGSIVTQLWNNLPNLQLFPYQLNTFNNIDFGCANSATIAKNEEMVVWLGVNEKSGPTIMVCAGGEVKQISTDGINFLFENLTHPENSFAFMFKQDGHVIYQLTFYTDNLTIAYDFNTNMFFHLSDEYMNAHIARKVTYFNGDYYFISYKYGNLYKFGSNITTYDGATIPRVRTTAPIRMDNTSPFKISNLSFPIEQGESGSLEVVDWSVSKDGGRSFSNSARKTLNPLGKRIGRISFRNFGIANDYTLQYKFLGKGRFVVGNGTWSYFQ